MLRREDAMEKMKNIRKKLRHQRSVRRRKLGLSTPTQIICVSFIIVIALGTLLLTGGDTLLQCMNSVGARELEPVCELESGIVLARFTYQGRTRYVITKSGGFGQEDLLVELADRIAKH